MNDSVPYSFIRSWCLPQGYEGALPSSTKDIALVCAWQKRLAAARACYVNKKAMPSWVSPAVMLAAVKGQCGGKPDWCSHEWNSSAGCNAMDSCLAQAETELSTFQDFGDGSCTDDCGAKPRVLSAASAGSEAQCLARCKANSDCLAFEVDRPKKRCTLLEVGRTDDEAREITRSQKTRGLGCFRKNSAVRPMGIMRVRGLSMELAPFKELGSGQCLDLGVLSFDFSETSVKLLSADSCSAKCAADLTCIAFAHGPDLEQKKSCILYSGGSVIGAGKEVVYKYLPTTPTTTTTTTTTTTMTYNCVFIGDTYASTERTGVITIEQVGCDITATHPEARWSPATGIVTNGKPGKVYLFGMEGEITGSATAQKIVWTITGEKWSEVEVTTTVTPTATTTTVVANSTNNTTTINSTTTTTVTTTTTTTLVWLSSNVTSSWSCVQKVAPVVCRGRPSCDFVPSIPGGQLNSACAGTGHGGVCAGSCIAGYIPRGEFECSFGEWLRVPHCVPLGASVAKLPATASIMFLNCKSCGFTQSVIQSTSMQQTISKLLTQLPYAAEAQRLLRDHRRLLGSSELDLVADVRVTSSYATKSGWAFGFVLISEGDADAAKVLAKLQVAQGSSGINTTCESAFQNDGWSFIDGAKDFSCVVNPPWPIMWDHVTSGDGPGPVTASQSTTTSAPLGTILPGEPTTAPNSNNLTSQAPKEIAKTTQKQTGTLQGLPDTIKAVSAVLVITTKEQMSLADNTLHQRLANAIAPGVQKWLGDLLPTSFQAEVQVAGVHAVRDKDFDNLRFEMDIDVLCFAGDPEIVKGFLRTAHDNQLSRTQLWQQLRTQLNIEGFPHRLLDKMFLYMNPEIQIREVRKDRALPNFNSNAGKGEPKTISGATGFSVEALLCTCAFMFLTIL